MFLARVGSESARILGRRTGMAKKKRSAPRPPPSRIPALWQAKFKPCLKSQSQRGIQAPPSLLPSLTVGLFASKELARVLTRLPRRRQTAGAPCFGRIEVSRKTLPNIEAIARLAGVSKSTVSRALNDSPLINRETKEKIRKIAEEHDFHINARARQLSTRQSRTIAFVAHLCSPDKPHGSFSAADLFSLEIMGSISRGLNELGYDLLVIHADPNDTKWARQYLDSGRVDGFILMTSARKTQHTRHLSEIGAPFVTWGMQLPGLKYCTVMGNNVEGGRLATEHLIRAGRRRICFLGGPAEELEVQARLEGYKNALTEAGLEIVPERIVHAAYWHEQDVAEALPRLLAQAPDIDALVTASDLMAIAAMAKLRPSGRRVPEDVAVVGFDDLSIAQFSSPPLTTIRQDLPLAGRMLAQNLIQYLETGIVNNVTLPVSLVVRESA